MPDVLCTRCAIDFGVIHGGLHDVTSHLRSKWHKGMSKAVASTTPIASLFRPQRSDQAIEVEVRWDTFVVKHNISFLASDHATKLFIKIFPDSAIAKKFSCSRTKTTAIVKKALAPHFTQRVIESMSSGPFSLMMDECNDRRDKSCIILVRLLDPQIGEVRTRFLDMPAVNIGTATNLFQALKESLTKNGLSFNNTVSFMSDTANVMKGVRSGVQKLIKDEIPLCMMLICHLADLTVKAGLKAIPVNIDQLFIAIFYYFHHSSKRKQQFVNLWYSLFTTEPEVILKDCPTCWLSLLKCVDRYLRQYDGLKSFFLSCEEAETAKVCSFLSRLENPLTKPLLHFLSFILPSMDQFNCLFQKSTENTTSQLYDAMNRLVRLYASKFLSDGTILAASDNLKNLDFDEANHVSNEYLGIGDDTWASVSQLEHLHDTAPFFKAIRSYYVSSTKKMLVKFPFGDSLMKDLRIIQPEHTSSFSFNTINSLAKRFPPIGLNDVVSLQNLKEQFQDFNFLPMIYRRWPSTRQLMLSWDPRQGFSGWKLGRWPHLKGSQDSISFTS